VSATLASLDAVPAGFVHAAFPYRDPAEYVDVLVPFVRAGLELDDRILVVTVPSQIELLCAALGDDAAAVTFGDMLELGRNPARIIPVWQDLLEQASAEGRGARGIGEPIHRARSRHEVHECIQHEALLNVAFDAGPAWSLVCPYDVAGLPASALEAADHTHPCCASAVGVQPSLGFTRPSAPADLLAGPALDEPHQVARELAFAAGQIREVRHLIGDIGRRHGLDPARLGDVELAVSEIATNSVMHGSGGGRLRLWVDGGSLVCEISDAGRISDPLVGRRRPDAHVIGGYGVWLANSVCDLVQFRSSDAGTVVRLHMHLPA
jgi:anti-sigma regulatory factor (Ser/Thr protein kinase)